MKSPAVADEVVTVPDTPADDADAEHVLDVQVWAEDEVKIVKLCEVSEVIPGLVATRVYRPAWLIDRSENEAMPPLAGTTTVPDRVPRPEFGPMATLTSALEAVSSWPHPFRTSTLTGPPWESGREVIFAPAAVSAGWPSLMNASELAVSVSVPERFPALAGSS